MPYYCTSDGQGPAASVDWPALARAVEAIPADGVDADGNEITTTRDAERAALHEQRIAIASHVVRNGGGPRVGTAASHAAATLPEDPRLLVLYGDTDAHGGRLVALDELTPLRCPECLALLRWVEG